MSCYAILCDARSPSLRPCVLRHESRSRMWSLFTPRARGNPERLGPHYVACGMQHPLLDGGGRMMRARAHMSYGKL